MLPVTFKKIRSRFSKNYLIVIKDETEAIGKLTKYALS